MESFPELDPDYATAVQDSYAIGRRFDDAMARVDGGFVQPNTFYVQSKPSFRYGSPLILALLDNAIAYIDEWLVRGADPNATFVAPDGIVHGPALFYVRSVEALQRIAGRGADLRAIRNGETFLHHCVRMTRVSRHPLWIRLAEAAVRLGADPRQPDQRGVDAIAFATEMGATVAKVYAPIFGVAGPVAASKAAKKNAPATSKKRGLHK